MIIVASHLPQNISVIAQFAALNIEDAIRSLRD